MSTSVLIQQSTAQSQKGTVGATPLPPFGRIFSYGLIRATAYFSNFIILPSEISIASSFSAIPHYEDPADIDLETDGGTGSAYFLGLF